MRRQNIIGGDNNRKLDTSIDTVKRTGKALKGFLKSYSVGITVTSDLLLQLYKSRASVEAFMKAEFQELGSFKFLETFVVTFEKAAPNGDGSIFRKGYFNCIAKTVTNENDIKSALSGSGQEIMQRIGSWMREGSGWVIETLDAHYINVAKYNPLKGGSYLVLPIELRNAKKGLVNVINSDDKCFMWCHVRYLNPQTKDPQRVKQTDKEKVKELNYSKVDFPVTVKSYSKIEKQNGINVNVFGYSKKEAYPIYLSKGSSEQVLNLLLITSDEKQHYVLITDFNRFMFNHTKHKEKKHFCMHCLQCFSSETILESHKTVCAKINGVQAVVMPELGSSVKFTNWNRGLEVPFVIYADFEALTMKVSGCEKSVEGSWTNEYQKHISCGYGYKLVCRYDSKLSKEVVCYRGENVIEKFLKAMVMESKWCLNVMAKSFGKAMVYTKENKKSYESETKCYICGSGYHSDKIRDHCKVTGRYRGSAHSLCSARNIMTKKIPVVFHNLRGYDSHFIMQSIGSISVESGLGINVIPNNMEKYMAFTLGNNLVFIDSFQFMGSGLDKLVSNLPADAFKLTTEYFTDKAHLVTRKGVYPYDYMDNYNKFKDKKLPEKGEFYSVLNDEHISDESYSHAKNVWKKFGLKNMGGYHDLYLKSDVLLLADVFENFRGTCLQYYGLDPCHYYSSPGLSWDAMLKMTDIKLELMTDIDMFQFIEKGLRGGTSGIMHRHGIANNKYMSNWNCEKKSKYLIYLDANNLYGWAMSQPMPYGGFKWMDPEKVKLSDYSVTSKKGVMLEVDLDYPESLHESHNTFPLAPETLVVKENMLSEYCKKYQKKFSIGVNGYKLIPNLHNKKKYVLHYKNLQLYKRLGLVVTKVHRVLEFNQSTWLGEYIDYNTKKRTIAKNGFEKDFFKLMNNSVFGKTMENIRKRVDVKLVTTGEKLNKLVSRPTFVSAKIFTEDLVAVHRKKESICLNRPAYIGMSILDVSKTLMYEFHYDYIKNKYGGKAKLLFTDTDSLCYEIKTDNIYTDLFADKEKFDNSDYPKDSKFYFDENKKVIGKMKDECGGKIMTEFIGLRSKMYSYIMADGGGTKKAKGVKKNTVRKNIKHECYKNVLANNTQMKHKMRTIRSSRHQIGSYEINKTSLSCFDDKRYILPDGISSLAYGNKKIPR